MAENKHTKGDLKQMQALPLRAKVRMTKYRITQWIEEFGEDGVYVSFSGGKDSTVLLDIVRNECGFKKVPAVFVDVPTQFPELRDFSKQYDNLIILRPHLSFMEVCEKYGFPLISKEVAQSLYDVNTQSKVMNCTKRETNLWNRKFNPESDYSKKYASFSFAKFDFLNDAPFECSHKCCSVLKKKPAKDFEKETGRKPIIATMACESRLRESRWMIAGCNAFDAKRPTSQPMSFWTENDVLQYIAEKNLPICSVYGDVVEDFEAEGELEGQMSIFDSHKIYKTTKMKRTGCMLCGFGCHMKDDKRFLILKDLHPKMYGLLDVCKNNGVTFREAIEWLNEHGRYDIKL